MNSTKGDAAVACPNAVSGKAQRFKACSPDVGQRIELVDNYQRRLGSGVYQGHYPHLGGHVVSTRGAMKIVARDDERWRPVQPPTAEAER